MNTHIFYIDYDKTKRNTAGAKAPDDVAAICGSIGYQKLSMPLLPAGKGKLFIKIWLMTVCVFSWLRNVRKVPESSVVIYQHPMYGIRVTEKMIPWLQKKHVRCVCLVHDLESLRKGIAGVISDRRKTNEIADNILLRHFDVVICHNKHMRDYLISQGFPPGKLVTLDIFDYLTGADTGRNERSRKGAPRVAVAGNLAYGKCSYIYNIVDEKQGRNPGLELNLYGVNYEEAKAGRNMFYKGSFKPEELPGVIEGDFGLVWDGNEISTCGGNTGEYLRYNNPHKTSLYLVSGMPVIVWSEAAMADFVIENGAGITVDSLEKLEEAISSVDDEAYARMCENARKIGKRLREGYYFRKAMAEALNRLGRSS